MTPEELKAHQIATFTLILEGNKAQHLGWITPGVWSDVDREHAIHVLASSEQAHRIRIKPEPRKVWVGWPKTGPLNWVPVRNGNGPDPTHQSPSYNWQLVEEVK